MTCARNCRRFVMPKPPLALFVFGSEAAEPQNRPSSNTCAVNWDQQAAKMGLGHSLFGSPSRHPQARWELAVPRPTLAIPHELARSRSLTPTAQSGGVDTKQGAPRSRHLLSAAGPHSWEPASRGSKERAIVRMWLLWSRSSRRTSSEVASSFPIGVRLANATALQSCPK